HLILNPAIETVGLGTAQQAPRGWIWVISTPGWQRRAAQPEPALATATLYPGNDQKDVPLYFGRGLSDMVSGLAKDHAAGFAVTANFPFGTRLRKTSGQLSGA